MLSDTSKDSKQNGSNRRKPSKRYILAKTSGHVCDHLIPLQVQQDEENKEIKRGQASNKTRRRMMEQKSWEVSKTNSRDWKRLTGAEACIRVIVVTYKARFSRTRITPLPRAARFRSRAAEKRKAVLRTERLPK